MMNDPIKNMMIEMVESYTVDKLNEFHHTTTTPNFLSSKPVACYIWGTTDSGYYTYTGTRGIYLDRSTGRAHRIRIDDGENTLQLEFDKQALLQKLTKVPMDTPVHFELDNTTVENKTWAYSVVERPNKQLGMNHFFAYHLYGKDPNEYFKEAVTIHTDLLRELPEVVAQLGDGLPRYCQPHKYLYDDKGLFIYDFKFWEVNRIGYIDYVVEGLKFRVKEWNDSPVPTKVDVDPLVDLAYNLWGKLDGFN
jgi:hypothetical protein